MGKKISECKTTTLKDDDIYEFNLESWQPTPVIKIFKTIYIDKIFGIKTKSSVNVLKQRWTSTKGNSQWRELPTEEQIVYL